MPLWRRYEHALDLLLLNIAYPVAFAAMGSIGAAIAARSWKTVSSAGAACAVSGVVGGVIFSAAIAFFPVRGYFEAIAFYASLAIPAFLSGRRLSALVAERAPYTSANPL